MYFAGTPDVSESLNAFSFTTLSQSATSNFTHVDDDICEGDELYMATFNLESNTIVGFQSRKVQPEITYIAIRDDDSEHLCIQIIIFIMIMCNIVLQSLSCILFHSANIIIDL